MSEDSFAPRMGCSVHDGDPGRVLIHPLVSALGFLSHQRRWPSGYPMWHPSGGRGQGPIPSRPPPPRPQDAPRRSVSPCGPGYRARVPSPILCTHALVPEARLCRRAGRRVQEGGPRGDSKAEDSQGKARPPRSIGGVRPGGCRCCDRPRCWGFLVGSTFR